MMPTQVETERLTLLRPTLADVDAVFAIASDPRLWTHYPSQRPTDRDQTVASITRWLSGWDEHGLDTWVVRVTGRTGLIGYGGCSFDRGVWNVGYRLAAEAHGHGYATELAQAGITSARALEPQRPVIALMVEHNRASSRVAEKVGLSLAYRALDTGNPDPDAMRLIYSDRTLSAPQLRLLIPGDA